MDINKTWLHDEGAYAQCFCGRYSDNPKALSGTVRCQCGHSNGWSGSFRKPSKRSRWNVEAQDADTEMLGNDADYFEAAGIDNIGCK